VGGDMMPKKYYIIFILVSLLAIGMMYFYLNLISKLGTVLNQYRLEKDIVLLTKDDLRKILIINVVDNGEYKEYTVKENGIVDKSSKLIQISAKSKNSNYPEGLEYRIAVKVLYHLNQRKAPYKISGVLINLTPSYVISRDYTAFISNKEFLVQLNRYRDIKDEEQLLMLITKNFIKKE
jgi:hypothetical protein